MSTITELAQSLATRAFNEVTAYDSNAVARTLELLLTERGYADESEVTDSSEKVSITYHLAYSVVVNALDVARQKLKSAEAGPTEAEFRDMVKDFEALLKRLARKAGIDENASPLTKQYFLVDKIPHFPET